VSNAISILGGTSHAPYIPGTFESLSDLRPAVRLAPQVVQGLGRNQALPGALSPAPSSDENAVSSVGISLNQDGRLA
jgi:hypothetical protein